MPEPIANLSPETVIELIEENLIDSSVALGRTEDGVVFRGSDVTWIYTGYRALSRVLRARFSPEEAEDRVAEIAECFQQWNAPVVWVIGPSTWPPKLSDHLQESGFNTTEIWMGMAVDLEAVPTALANHSSLRIEQVDQTSQLDAWTQLSNEFWPSECTAGAVSIFSPENAGGDPRCKFYLGYANDKPVSRVMCCTRGETAGLYWMHIQPEHREKGFDIAIAARALIDAKTTGAKLGVMPARSATAPVCQKIGFKQYCQFHLYNWPATPAKVPVC